MLCKIYIFLFQFIIYDLTIVTALKGENVIKVEQHEFPAVVCIGKKQDLLEWERSIVCSGVLLSKMMVLTAQDCLQQANLTQYEIAMGSHYPSVATKYVPLWWISFDDWIRKHGTRQKVPFRSVMVIKVLGPDSGIYPFTMASIQQDSDMFGIDVDMVGCGRISSREMPEVIHKAVVKILSRTDCEATLKSLGKEVSVPDKFYCSIADPYAFIDKGDSGGPISYFGVVVGINVGVSPRMNNKFHPKKVNVHANVFFFNEFVNHLLNEDKLSNVEFS